MDYSAQVLRYFDAELAAPTSNRVAPSEAENDSAVAVRSPEMAETRLAGRWVTGEAEDRTLNVWVRFRVEVAQGVIETVTPEVFGCPHTIAAAGWVSHWLAAAPVERLGQLDVNQLRQTLEVPVEKLGKLLRVEEALLACLADYQRPPIRFAASEPGNARRN